MVTPTEDKTVIQAAPQPGPPPQSFDCSVIISLFNKEPYIERALRSILDQTMTPREIIVVDGGSSDNGPDLVDALARDNPSIRFIRQVDNGVSEGRNRGIAEAQTEWVSFLDGDDAYLPWYIEEMSRLAQLSPEAIFLGGRVQEEPPDFHLDTLVPIVDEPTVERGRVKHFYDRWWRGNIFYTSSFCARRSALMEFNEPFPVGEHLGEDLELFFRLAERGPLAATSRVSAIYAAGVPEGLSSVGELDLIPSFQRLRARVASPGFPADELPGARRCLATKWLSVARTRYRHGDLAGALELMREPITGHRPVYWVRTAGLIAVAAARQAVGRRSSSNTDVSQR